MQDSVAISYYKAKANKNEPNNFGSFFHIFGLQQDL